MLGVPAVMIPSHAAVCCLSGSFSYRFFWGVSVVHLFLSTPYSLIWARHGEYSYACCGLIFPVCIVLTLDDGMVGDAVFQHSHDYLGENSVVVEIGA